MVSSALCTVSQLGPVHCVSAQLSSLFHLNSALHTSAVIDNFSATWCSYRLFSGVSIAVSVLLMLSLTVSAVVSSAVSVLLQAAIVHRSIAGRLDVCSFYCRCYHDGCEVAPDGFWQLVGGELFVADGELLLGDRLAAMCEQALADCLELGNW